MAIDAVTLRNSLVTSAVWANAILKGVEECCDNKPIYVKVTGIQAPTFMPNSGGDPSGCCVAVKPTEPPTIEGEDQLIESLRNLARYLDLLKKSV